MEHDTWPNSFVIRGRAARPRHDPTIQAMMGLLAVVLFWCLLAGVEGQNSTCTPCNNDSECVGRCVRQQCTLDIDRGLDVGCVCSAKDDCDSRRCDGIFSPTCQAALENGALCNEDSDCMSGNCNAFFRCVATPEPSPPTVRPTRSPTAPPTTPTSGTKELGEACTLDSDCASLYCNFDSICDVKRGSSSNNDETWVWVTIVVVMVVGMLIALAARHGRGFPAMCVCDFPDSRCCCCCDCLACLC